MTVLVTGANGFIGSNLVWALTRMGQRVRVLQRPNSNLTLLAGLDLEYRVGDILDEASVTDAVKRCEVVYHVAAVADYWRTSPQTIYRTNVDGTRIVMEACLRAGVSRVVHTSSISAIGISPPGVVGTEETLFDSRSAKFAYADSKRLGETQVQEFVARGLPAVIVNPSVVVGPRDRGMSVGTFVREFQRGRIAGVPPGGICIADVDAVVHGHIAAAEHGRIGERYILGGENLTFRQIADTMADIIGRPAPRFIVPGWTLGPVALGIDIMNRLSHRPAVVSGEQIRLSGECHFFDSGKAIRELNYPLMPFRPALEKACIWYRENGYLGTTH